MGSIGKPQTEGEGIGTQLRRNKRIWLPLWFAWQVMKPGPGCELLILGLANLMHALSIMLSVEVLVADGHASSFPNEATIEQHKCE